MEDLLLSSRTTNTILIHTLDETLSESPDIILYPTGDDTGSRIFGEVLGTDYDFNGDGFPDLAVYDRRATIGIPHDLLYMPYGRLAAVYESPLVDGAEPDWTFYGHSGYVGRTPPLAVDINNDGHLDLVYIDPELGFGQTKSGVVAIKLGPFGYPHFNMLSWSSILDAEYWITGSANEINKATIIISTPMDRHISFPPPKLKPYTSLSRLLQDILLSMRNHELSKTPQKIVILPMVWWKQC